jgi:hypothetical protein
MYNAAEPQYVLCSLVAKIINKVESRIKGKVSHEVNYNLHIPDSYKRETLKG